MTLTLEAIQGEMLATPGTVAAWKQVLEDHPQARITSPAGAYRSEAMVVAMYLSSPMRRLAVYGVPLGVGVAKPISLGGKGSVHQNGKCIDVSSMTSIYRAALIDAGFVNTLSTESWHWEYRGPEGGGSSGSGINETPTKDDDMKLFAYQPTAGVTQSYLLSGPGIHDVVNFDQAVALGASTGQDATKLPSIGVGTYNELAAAAERFRESIAAKVKPSTPGAGDG